MMEATEEQIASLIDRFDDSNWRVYGSHNRLAIQMAAIGVKALPQLSKALKSDSTERRAGAAQALGGIPSDQTLDLLRGALNDPDVLVRQHAVYGLSEVGSQEAVSLLVQTWEIETDQNVCEAIVCAFEKLRMPEVETILLNAMNESAFNTAWPAAMILSNWDHPQAPIGMLGIAMRATEEQWETYDFAGEAVYVLGKGGVSVIPTYIEALENESEYVHNIVAAALGYMRDPQAVPALIRLRDDPDEYVRFKSILSLGRIGTPEALTMLLPLLRNDTPETEYALKAVHHVTDTQIIAACADCLLHSEYRILFPAADALATQGPNGIAALIAALTSPVATTRIAATDGLRHTKDRIATEPLIRALNDENERVRSTAAWGLGSISDPRAADALLAALDDQAACGQAAVALGKMGDRRAVPKICALLESDDFAIRRSAVGALWDLADSDSYDALLNACTNQDDFVQEQAAMALGWLNLPEAADHFVSMLRHEQSFEARKGAAYALGALGLEWTRTELIRAWWEDPDINVFYAAHASLEHFGNRDLCSPEEEASEKRIWYGG